MFELAPWKPFRELTSLRRDMDRLWEDFLGGREAVPMMEGAWAPAVDISETKDAVVVRAEIPGMEAKDIDISMTGDTLVIKGEKRQEKEEKGENYQRIERRYGAFRRSIRLPVSVDANKIKATYKRGVLSITLPKSEEVKARQIEIKEG